MKAAIVAEAGKPPVYGEFPGPTPAGGTHLVTVAASALSHLTHSRASGKHYSASHRLPFVPGVDGVGFLADGRRVYFLVPEAPFGGMGERTLVQATHCVELPAGLDTIRAAALANPGMSSWAALKERAHLAPGETVLINGATGTSGRLAVRIAKHLGAGRVIATGRNAHTLASLSVLGADATLSLAQDKETLERGFQTHFREGVDVVLDYLWGESAEVLMDAAVKAASGAVPSSSTRSSIFSSGSTGLLDGGRWRRDRNRRRLRGRRGCCRDGAWCAHRFLLVFKFKLHVLNY